VSEFVGPCFLPELSPLPAPNAVFSPLVKSNVLSEGVDELDESPDVEMNVIRATESPRRHLRSSTWSGGFGVLRDEESSASGCWLAVAIRPALTNGPSIF
jgi:hypothetical protein